jgi:arylsulfatase
VVRGIPFRSAAIAAAGLALAMLAAYAVWGFASYRFTPLPETRTTVSREPIRLSPGPASADELRAAMADANVVICVLDAARPDHIGCYGYARDTTPNIDKLAEEAIVFERHHCPYPMTKSSTASLFTGQHADTHLAMQLHEMAPGTFTMDIGMRAAGLHTAFFSSSGWASSPLGIGNSFDVAYSPVRGPRGPGPPRGQSAASGPQPRLRSATREAEDLLDAFADWLETRPQQRFFAYLHFLPPHSPYRAPEEMVQLFAGRRPPHYRRGGFPFRDITERGGPAEHQKPGPDLINSYDANLRYADWALGEVQRLLRDAGLYQNTLFIFTADHGEAFGEHGYRWHPSCPFDETLHIPLIVKLPGRDGPTGRVAALTSTVDLLPTIYELLGIPYPQTCVQGRSLMPLLAGEAEKVRDYAFARTGGQVPCYVVRDLRHTLLLFEGGELRALYDIQEDPWQTRNIIRDRPEVTVRMAEAFRRFALTQTNRPVHFLDPDAAPAPRRETPEVQLTEEMREELEALGYLK